MQEHCITIVLGSPGLRVIRHKEIEYEIRVEVEYCIVSAVCHLCEKETLKLHSR